MSERSFEKKVLSTVLWAILPSYLLALFLIWHIDISFYLQALVSIFLTAVVGFSFHCFYYELKDQFISLAILI
jgi:hypothetical protein